MSPTRVIPLMCPMRPMSPTPVTPTHRICVCPTAQGGYVATMAVAGFVFRSEILSLSPTVLVAGLGVSILLAAGIEVRLSKHDADQAVFG